MKLCKHNAYSKTVFTEGPAPASTYSTHQNPLTPANKLCNPAEIQQSAFHFPQEQSQSRQKSRGKTNKPLKQTNKCLKYPELDWNKQFEEVLCIIFWIILNMQWRFIIKLDEGLGAFGIVLWSRILEMPRAVLFKYRFCWHFYYVFIFISF